jgi:hypothetical protein
MSTNNTTPKTTEMTVQIFWPRVLYLHAEQEQQQKILSSKDFSRVSCKTRSAMTTCQANSLACSRGDETESAQLIDPRAESVRAPPSHFHFSHLLAMLLVEQVDRAVFSGFLVRHLGVW